MQQLFLRFSGVLAMFIAWFFVVMPSMRLGINVKNQTISSATKDTTTRRIISIGLVVGALLQVVFIFYLIQKLQMHLLNIGCLLFLSTNMATILVAFFTEQKHRKIHQALTEYYFIVNPLSLICIGLSVIKTVPVVFIISLLIALFYFIGLWWLLKKFSNKNTLMEVWAFFMLSLWTIFMTVL